MSTKIQIKKSSVSGNQPPVGSLAEGELAVNIPDKKLWVGTGGVSDSAVLLVDYNNVGNQLTEGAGINITTNNEIQLDLNNNLPTALSVDKYDYIPFLDVTSTGTSLGTKKVSARQFLQTGLSSALSIEAWDGNPQNDEKTIISIQDGNPNAFSIKTLQNASGSKLDILKIDTDIVGGANTLIGGTEFRVDSTSSIVLGIAPLTINSYNIDMANVTNINMGVNSSITGIGSITPSVITNQTLYIQGNLVVTGFIETDVGLRGNTNDDNEYLGTGMTLDGGEF